MNPSELKVGDRIRITGVANWPTLPPETKQVWLKLKERKRSVRICEIKDGQPWYNCRFKANGKWEYHSLSIGIEERNWVKVKRRTTR